MKNTIITLIFIFIVVFSFGQTKSYYKITGRVLDTNTYQQLEGCRIKLFTSAGLFIEVRTNKKGYYSFDSLSMINKGVNLEVTKKGYLTNNENRKSILFDNVPHDTIINFKIKPIPFSGTFFPEIYFKYNSDIPDSSYHYCLDDIEGLMKGFYHQKLVIIGYKDSLETIDKRKERAELVYNLLIKKGIDKNKLTIDMSSKPNFGKYLHIILETGESIYPDITESYILNAPIDVQESLRQLNRIVSFSIISDE